MRILSYYPMKIIKIIFEFESGYRIWDISQSKYVSNQLVVEVAKESEFFMSVQLDKEKEEIYWDNGLRISTSTIYEESREINTITAADRERKRCRTPLKKTLFKGETKMERENAKLLEITLARKENW